MTNLIEANYNQTGQSKKTNHLGMREMQQMVYEKKDAKYLLLKAPPASGKSRALMFIALDKLINQGIKKASGKYPVLQRATTKMATVAELEKNPALAKPDFKDVAWTIDTYRGAIPLSQESIDDADVDLVSLVSESISQIKVNTTNDAIATVLKTFTTKTVANLDEIKKLLNGFDPAYNVSLIVSQSFYQALDTLKDGNGRYLLQDDITAVSGKTLLGKPVFVLSDEVIGANKAFVGDFKRGVLFADRKDLGLRWADNEIYGQYLQAVLRFGVTKVDAKAGYYVTYTPAP